jgi:hypothetical protein
MTLPRIRLDLRIEISVSSVSSVIDPLFDFLLLPGVAEDAACTCRFSLSASRSATGFFSAKTVLLLPLALSLSSENEN